MKTKFKNKYDAITTIKNYIINSLSKNYNMSDDAGNGISSYYGITKNNSTKCFNLRLSNHSGKYAGYDVSADFSDCLRFEYILNDDALKEMKITAFEDDLSGEWLYKNSDGIVKEDFQDFKEYLEFEKDWNWNNDNNSYDRWVINYIRIDDLIVWIKEELAKFFN